MMRRGGNRVMLQAGPVLARDAAPDRTRHVECDGEARAMSPLPSIASLPLSWRQPRTFRSVWWLESERGTHLMLHAPAGLAPFNLTKPWEVEAATGSWRLSRAWFGPISLTDADGSVLLRHHDRGFGLARVQPAAGAALAVRRSWKRSATLRDAHEHELFTLEPAFAWFRREARLTLTDAARRRDDLLPLLAITWVADICAARRRAHGAGAAG